MKHEPNRDLFETPTAANELFNMISSRRYLLVSPCRDEAQYKDPASVYLYRGEPREVAEQMGIDCSRFSSPIVPVIYNLNLRDPNGYFLATKFEMRNKDVIFASNSASVEASC